MRRYKIIMKFNVAASFYNKLPTFCLTSSFNCILEFIKKAPQKNVNTYIPQKNYYFQRFPYKCLFKKKKHIFPIVHILKECDLNEIPYQIFVLHVFIHCMRLRGDCGEMWKKQYRKKKFERKVIIFYDFNTSKQVHINSNVH